VTVDGSGLSWRRRREAAGTQTREVGVSLTAFEVKEYDLKLNREGRTAYSAGGVRFGAGIKCMADDGRYLLVWFVYSMSSAPDNGTQPDLSWGYSCVPMSHYPYYVDMLRNEKPVFATLCTHAPEFNGIGTHAEPVGEEEAPPEPPSKLKKAKGMKRIEPQS
jgi:hypothetical protein